MSKGEIPRFEQFLLLSLCFQTAVCCRGVRKRLYQGKGYKRPGKYIVENDVAKVEITHYKQTRIQAVSTLLKSFSPSKISGFVYKVLNMNTPFEMKRNM